MSRRKGGKPKTESKEIPVADASAAAWEPVVLESSVAKSAPRPCGAPEVQKTDDIGVRGEGGEFIKRGGKLYRS